MGQVTIIGIDLAKRSFRLHGAQANGSVAFRRKLSRGKLLDFLASQPRCVVAMEACASAHHWGRENGKSLPQFGLHRAHIDGQVAFAGVVRRDSSPPIGALTHCFSLIRGGQFSALNNT